MRNRTALAVLLKTGARCVNLRGDWRRGGCAVGITIRGRGPAGAHAHGGCASPCRRYGVIVRGDGTVTYDGLVIYDGAGQVGGVRTRSIPVDEVISLVNEFLRARFFDAFDTYTDERSFAMRDRICAGKRAQDHMSTSLHSRLLGPY